MFLGTHFPKLDDKGRLFLPAKFRDELADGLVITRGQERSLSVWPEREFVQLTESPVWTETFAGENPALLIVTPAEPASAVDPSARTTSATAPMSTFLM